MKVIQIIPKLELAGAEVMCENLSLALKKKGINVLIVSLYNKETEITRRLGNEGIKIVYLNKKSGVDFSVILDLIHIFRKEKPDVIHTHINVLQYAYIAAILSSVKKSVHTMHSVAEKEATPIRQRLYNLIFKSKIVVPVALSEEIKRSVIRRYRLSDEKVPVIYNGIDLKKCIPKEDYSANAHFTFIHIGRFADVKNHELLINAFRKLHDEYPTTRLWLLGQGPLYEDIKKKVQLLGLSESVEFLGLQPEVHEYLHNADAFVLPSKYEGMPMTLIEAMGTGLPIIASNVGGIPSMIDNYKNGLLIDANKDELLKSMKEILDKDLREKIGTAARKKSEDFSSDIMAERYLSVYNSSVSNTGDYY